MDKIVRPEQAIYWPNFLTRCIKRPKSYPVSKEVGELFNSGKTRKQERKIDDAL
jgi:hypothetical protein